MKPLDNCIEKSGTGIERSYSAIERSGTGVRVGRLLLLICVLSLPPLAFGVVGNGTGKSSDQTPFPIVSLNTNLATVSFVDGYQVVSGYGHIERDYSRVYLYSLEYVDVMNIGGSETISVVGNGTGAPVDDENDSEIAPVVGNGTGTASETIPVVGNGTGTASETPPVQGGGTGGKSTGESGGQLKPWGIAEVVFNGNQADIILYQFNEEGVLQEAGVYADVGIQ